MFSRRNFLRTLGLGAFSLAASSISKATAQAVRGKQPNIVFVLVDDMGWSDIGCYGGEVHTPHLDRLAKGGIRFSQFHNTAKCFPSRACLMTGLYAQQCGMARKPLHFEHCVTFAEVLKAAGYRTLMTGKHHGLDNPYDRGFDRYFGLRDGTCNSWNPGLQRAGEGVPAHKKGPQFFPRTWCIDGEIHAPYTPPEKDFYTTDYFTKYALQYLDEYKDERKPFFLYIAYNAPHDPLMAWPEDIAKYRGKYKKGYASYRKARYRRQLEMGLIDETFPLSEPYYGDWDALSAEEQDKEDNRMAVYAAMIDRVDQNIGKLLAKIEERGELDNTLFMFASDNGCAASSDGNYRGYNPTANQGEMGSLTRWTKIGKSWSNVSNTPFRFYKAYTHKGGSCTPLIAHWPKGIAGKNRVSHAVGHFIDIMPTMVEASGAAYPWEFKGEAIPPMAGRSLLPIFQNKEQPERDPIYWQYSKGKAVRYKHWRLVSDENGPWSLYDMRTDKTETMDVIKKYPKTAAKLETMYDAWAAPYTER